MTFPRRKQLRLQYYDYSTVGYYFVTICTQGRLCLFGEVIDGEMRLNDAGHCVQVVWNRLPKRYGGVEIDEFIVMPNHVHGIVVVTQCPELADVGAIHELLLRMKRRNMVISKAMGYLKMNSAKQINVMRGTCGVPVWQRNYYEHVIRTEDDLSKARQYIQENPLKWDLDPENPHRRLTLKNHAAR